MEAMVQQVNKTDMEENEKAQEKEPFIITFGEYIVNRFEDLHGNTRTASKTGLGIELIKYLEEHYDDIKGKTGQEVFDYIGSLGNTNLWIASRQLLANYKLVCKYYEAECEPIKRDFKKFKELNNEFKKWSL